MIVNFNKRFSQLLKEYNLPKDLSFFVDIPAEVQTIINSTIHMTEMGVTLGSNKLYKPMETGENQSTIEDDVNHFHVDWYIDPPNNKRAFMLGIKTLMLLAIKFQMQKIGGIRCWYHFKTPEQAKEFAQFHNLHSDDDDYYISDRLSFYTRRNGEDIITINEGDSFNALLIVDL